jgi:hypothetical protein
MNKIAALVSLALPFALCACVSFPEASMHETEKTVPAFSYLRLAPTPPPEPLMEMKPQPDEPTQQVWRRGYWSYDGRNYTWVSGEYISRPAPTAAWSGERWEKRSFGWAFVPGYWF